MEFSKTKIELQGWGLIEQVIYLTGLPDQVIRKELETLVGQNGKDANTLTLEQLRDLLARYLEQTPEFHGWSGVSKDRPENESGE